MKTAQKPFPKNLIRFVVELVIYAVLITVYLALVVTFIADWLKELFHQQPITYAFISLILMILQAVGLEKLTAIVIHVSRRRRS